MGDFVDTKKLKVVMEAEKYMFGNNKSEIFRKYGIDREATDYAKKLENSKHTTDIEYYIGAYKGITYGISSIGVYSEFWRFGICPIIDYSDIDLPVLDLTRNSNGVLETTFGFLPNEKQDKKMESILNENLKNYNLLKSSLSYTIDISTWMSNRISYDKVNGYLFDNQIYVYVHDAWFKVLPVKWWVDEKNKLLIAQKILVSNILGRDLQNYMNKIFIKELCQNPANTKSASENDVNLKINNLTTIGTQLDDIKREEQLTKFMNQEAEQLKLNALGVTFFGSNLTSHAKAIFDASFSIVDAMDNASIYDIKGEIKKLNQRKASNFIFSRSYSASEITQNNKRILMAVEESLIEQHKVMLEQVKRFDYTKKLISIFINRLNEYISQMKNGLQELNNERSFNESENSDYITMKTILENQLEAYEKAVSVQKMQYENIDLLLRNYAISLKKIMTYFTVTLPSLSTAVAISHGILAQNESLNSINEINIFLDNIINYNDEFLHKQKQIESQEKLPNGVLLNNVDDQIIKLTNSRQTVEQSSVKKIMKK